MSLDAFFAQAVPMVRGGRTAAEVEAALGPSPTGTEALDFYARQQRVLTARVLSELFGAVHARVAARGPRAWRDLAAAYFQAHPATGWNLPFVGASFADWLEREDPEGPLLASVADLAWTRWKARHAPDAVQGDGEDVRWFIRQWPYDAVAATRALREDPAAHVAPAATLLFLWRDPASFALRHRVPSLATLAVLWRQCGRSLAGPLAAVPPDQLTEEAARLVADGVFEAVPLEFR